MALETGQVVENRYRIVHMLAQGGMGSIYKAWDTRLNRPVALKEMIPQPGLDAEMLEQLRKQFENEAQVLATLSHPNLVRVTDYFSWEDNEYLVMDFVDGKSLATLIEEQGPQNERSILHWTAQLLDTLAYCHRKGVLHRDIKPQNIIVTTDDEAILVDFGLVKLWDPSAPETRTVMRGAGTPEYAPPEQYDFGMGHTDPRSDIYSLGATLYHAFTGRTPPTATQRMANPASFIPPRSINAGITPRTEAAVLRAMEVAMNQRFQDAREMAGAFGIRLRQRRTTAPRPVTPGGTVVLPGERRPEPAKRRPPTRPPQASAARKPRRSLLVGLGAAAFVCLIAGGICAAVVLLDGVGTPTPTAEYGGVTPTVPPSPTPAALDSVTAQPAPTITPSGAGGGAGVLLEDDFGDVNTGWTNEEYDNGSVGYAAGYYYVIASGENTAVWGVAGQDLENVAIDVDTTQASASANDNNAYGVICRQQRNGDGYMLRISGDGFYSIQRIEDGAFEPLVPWTSSDVVRQGNASNHIRAICDGPNLVLIANGQELTRTTDTTFRSGDIGLTATSFEAEPTEVRFDNLRVTLPDVLPVTADILFEDDFDDPNTGWDVWDSEAGSVAGYSNGTYRIVATGGQWMWGGSNHHFTDVEIDVQTTQVSAPPNDNNGYGVICRVQSNEWGDGYGLVISGDGFYSIQRISQGSWEPLIEWTRSNVINRGNADNTVRAVCSGSHLMLIVNGQLIAEADDDAYPSGDVSLVATTFEDESTEIHFDDLVVRRPQR
jgi:tRNA A-37 threonylcarbamoyl transferase component Bud32